MRAILFTVITAIGATALAEVKLKCPEGTEQTKEQYQNGGETFSCVKNAADGQAVKHGPTIGFKSSGVKGYEANFVNGAKDGTFKLFYENGQMKEVSQLKLGKYVGKTTWYYENGKKKADGQYVDDAESGSWTFYDDTGVKVAQGPFKDAVRKFKQLQAKKDQRAMEVKQSALAQGAPCGEWLDFQSQDAYAREVASQVEATGQDVRVVFPNLEDKRVVAKVKFEHQKDLFERKTKMKFDSAWCR